MKHFEMFVPVEAEDNVIDAMRYFDDVHIIRTETVQVDPIMDSPAVVIYFTSGANLGHDFIEKVRIDTNIDWLDFKTYNYWDES